ncbi:hypothetical protein Tco_1431041 [Tanacetum coccineum]
MINESLEHVVLGKESSQPQSSYEAAATLIEFELKKILIDKIDKNKSYLAAPEHRDCYEGLRNLMNSTRLSSLLMIKSLATCPKVKESQSGSSKGDKSQSKSSGKSVQSEKPEFEFGDSDMPQDQKENLGNNDEEPKEKTPQQGQNQSWSMTLASSTDKPSKTFNELMSTSIDFSAFIMNGLKSHLTQENTALLEKLDWENLEGGDYPFDLTKPLPLVMSRNCQKVPIDYFFNNDLKYLQGGISTMTYTTSLTKTKATQYDLAGIEDMVPDIWVPVKAAYDLHALWGIYHWREQHKTFYAYARGLQSRHDVYSMKRILAVNQVEVMRKHRYGYLKEIVVRRADNIIYRFKEGDFLRLRTNDIEDMLLLVFQNRLTNLLGDDVSDFAIALRMFTRSLVIHKKETRTLHTKTLKDSFMSTTMEEIDLAKRCWSKLEKKRANIMIKSIDKALKERRLMRSLKKFVGGRHYETDLRLLQRTI